MGRFYNTAQASFVDDIMYEAPTDLMTQAIGVKDQERQNTENEIGSLNSLLKGLGNLKQDDQEVNDKRLEYTQKINDLSQMVYENKDGYQKRLPEISKLSQELLAELDTGVFGSAKKNLDRENALVERVNKNKDFTDRQKQALINTRKGRYKGLNFNDTGDYKQYDDSGEILQSLDYDDIRKNTKDAITADQTATASSFNSKTGYIYKLKGTNKFVTEDTIIKSIDNNPEFQKFIDKEAQTLRREGELSGEDPNITEQKIRDFHNKSRNGLINDLSYNQETKDKSMKNDSLFNKREADARKQAERNEDVNMFVPRINVNRSTGNNFNSTATEIAIGEKHKKSLAKAFSVGGFTDLKDYAAKTATPQAKRESDKAIYDKLGQKGLDEFVEARNDAYKNVDRFGITYKGEGSENLTPLQKSKMDKKFKDAIVESINNRPGDQEVNKANIILPNGSVKTLEDINGAISTVAGVNKFVVDSGIKIFPQNKAYTEIVKRDDMDNILDENGNTILGEGGFPIKELSDVPNDIKIGVDQEVKYIQAVNDKSLAVNPNKVMEYMEHRANPWEKDTKTSMITYSVQGLDQNNRLITIEVTDKLEDLEPELIK